MNKGVNMLMDTMTIPSEIFQTRNLLIAQENASHFGIKAIVLTAKDVNSLIINQSQSTKYAYQSIFIFYKNLLNKAIQSYYVFLEFDKKILIIYYSCTFS
jgi:hypothetical protein